MPIKQHFVKIIVFAPINSHSFVYYFIICDGGGKYEVLHANDVVPTNFLCDAYISEMICLLLREIWLDLLFETRCHIFAFRFTHKCGNKCICVHMIRTGYYRKEYQ